MKTILGLDLGTNSIGWALIKQNEENLFIEKPQLGSRIIPMSQDVLGNFDAGNSYSQTAERTKYRGIRRLRERALLRRERLHRVLHRMGFLPLHYEKQIGWNKSESKTYGKFIDNAEPKLAWQPNEEGGFQFLFMDSFHEMLAEFAHTHPSLVENEKKIPYDWTLYYLRKKALHKPISKEELAWIILNFNQKRGYYQLRGEEEEDNPLKQVAYYALKVEKVEEREAGKKKGEVWYDVTLENEWVYSRSSKIPLYDWIGKTKEFIVTTDLNPDGSFKKRSFRAPDEKDWTLVKKKTENDIGRSDKTVGEYIYDALLSNPSGKIRGKLVRTIERKFYKKELIAIFKKQCEYHAELQDKVLYTQCIEELYTQNQSYRQSIADRDFVYLFVENIIFYQRPLKSKKSLIQNCPYEVRKYVDLETRELKEEYIKCIAKSNPYYQEFRLWQFIQNLRIYQREGIENGKLVTDIDVTLQFLPSVEEYVALYEWLNSRKNITQDTLLGSFLKLKKPKAKGSNYAYRWNYVEDKEYPCNETRAQLAARLEKANIPDQIIQNKDFEYALWQMLYTVEDKLEIEKALSSFAQKYLLLIGEENASAFKEAFKNMPPFKKDYGAYSEKATKKLLSLMRIGKYWSEKAIPEKVQQRIQKIIDGECDESIRIRVREKLKSRNFTDLSDFQGLPLWLACYTVYDRHSEAKDITKWESPSDLKDYLKSFKQHSLRNPIVEQVITETLRTVHDIWVAAGQIDEIHVELGREMKNPADKRAKMALQNQENETRNLRIKTMLMELQNTSDVENVRPYSPSQQEILKIYEEGALSTLSDTDSEFEFVSKMVKTAQPSSSDIIRYKLWLEQRYRSPYTGNVIPLSKLFTTAYQIEHIIPQARYFDDSLSNKVICESEVNKEKGQLLGFEFIKNNEDRVIELSFGKATKIFTAAAYEKFVKEHYQGNRSKMKKLLMDEIPSEFIARQLNDSRYISKVVKSLLSNIVREVGEEEAISKNVITCTGGVTDRLKHDWGLHDVWNHIVYPRFERLNELTGTSQFGGWTNKDGKRVFQTQMPIELQKGFNKKRIDHRHHAMDALVIACANRNVVNYLNNESAKKEAKTTRYDLQHALCDKQYTDKNGNYKWQVRKPWKTFTEDAEQSLRALVVSFKKNVRIVNKTTNYTEQIDTTTGKKILQKQTKGEQIAIRKPLHKETVYGRVKLQKKKQVALSAALNEPENLVDKKLRAQVQQFFQNGMDKKGVLKFFKEQDNIWNGDSIAKVEIFYYDDQFVATRKTIDTSFTKKNIEDKITDTGIQKILLNYLEVKGGDPELAFTSEGIADMNANIALYNDGKLHQPILKARIYETLGNKYPVGYAGNRKTKYVEAEKGTNLFFAIYENGEGKRNYMSIPLNTVAERLKLGDLPAPETNDDGDKLKFWLSPNDLVYVPTLEEKENEVSGTELDKERIYKMVSSTNSQVFFVPLTYSSPIMKNEMGANNKAERMISLKNQLAVYDEKETLSIIKSICWKLEVDRLGRIVKIIR